MADDLDLESVEPPHVVGVSAPDLGGSMN